jgi:probable phosphoglycerate mutase
MRAAARDGKRLCSPAVESPSVLILVRHGETAANIDQVWHGSIDTPLTPRGEQQAARVAERIQVDFPDATTIYSSDLQRARNTARAIHDRLGVEHHARADLREYDLGSWEGKTFAELHDELEFFHHIRSDPDFAPHGGESPHSVATRLSSALSRIAAAHPGERVVVVTHGGALSMAMGAILDGHYREWHAVMDNCAISELVFEPKPALLSFNRTEHLENL